MNHTWAIDKIDWQDPQNPLPILRLREPAQSLKGLLNIVAEHKPYVASSRKQVEFHHRLTAQFLLP